MIEHAKRDRRLATPWEITASISILVLAVLLMLHVVASTPKPHTHPAADGIVTRAEIEAMLVQVNLEHAKQRAAIEAVNVRVDKLRAGVKAMVPRIKGRDRVNALVEEAGR